MKGIFQGVYMAYPAGSMRKLKVGEQEFPVDFEMIYNQTKGFKQGDQVELKYKDPEHFTIKKI